MEMAGRYRHSQVAGGGPGWQVAGGLGCDDIASACLEVGAAPRAALAAATGRSVEASYVVTRSRPYLRDNEISTRPDDWLEPSRRSDVPVLTCVPSLHSSLSCSGGLVGRLRPCRKSTLRRHYALQRWWPPVMTGCRFAEKPRWRTGPRSACA